MLLQSDDCALYYSCRLTCSVKSNVASKTCSDGGRLNLAKFSLAVHRPIGAPDRRVSQDLNGFGGFFKAFSVLTLAEGPLWRVFDQRLFKTSTHPEHHREMVPVRKSFRTSVHPRPF